MARPRSKQDFKDWLLRKLGHPYQQIEISPEQLDDVIFEALEFYSLNIYEGSKDKIYRVDLPTAASQEPFELDLSVEIPNQTIYSISNIWQSSQFAGVIPSAYGVTQADIDFFFNIGRMVATSTDLVDYDLTFQHLSAIQKVLNTKIDWDYNFNDSKLSIHSGIQDTMIFIVATVLVDYEGISNGRVWTNKFLQDYTVALAKLQWGMNLGPKYSGFNIPGGGTIEAQQMVQEAEDKKLQLEEMAYENLGFDPSAFGIHMS